MAILRFAWLLLAGRLPVEPFNGLASINIKININNIVDRNNVEIGDNTLGIAAI